MAWGNTHHFYILPIFFRQKTAIRIVCKVKADHYTSWLFHSMKLLNFWEIIELSAAIFMYRAFRKVLPYNWQRYFTIKSNEYGIETNQKNMLCQTFACTTRKQHCMSVAEVKLWYNINNNKNSHSMLTPKKSYDEYHVSILFCNWSMFSNIYCFKDVIIDIQSHRMIDMQSLNIYVSYWACIYLHMQSTCNLHQSNEYICANVPMCAFMDMVTNIYIIYYNIIYFSTYNMRYITNTTMSAPFISSVESF